MKKICILALSFFTFSLLNPTAFADSPDKTYQDYTKYSDKASHFTFSDLPRHLGHDLKESFWGWGSLGLAVGAGISGALYQKDSEIQSDLTIHGWFGETGDKVINVMGSPYTMAGIGIVTTITGAGIKNTKLRTTGESILEALFWTELFTIGMQYAFDRTRPNGESRGFPSGHTSGVFSTATVLEVMYGPKVGIPAYAFATLVGLARIDSFEHFTTDVLMGATLGTVIGYGTARFHKRLHNDFSLTPMLSPNQYGMNLSHEF